MKTMRKANRTSLEAICHWRLAWLPSSVTVVTLQPSPPLDDPLSERRLSEDRGEGRGGLSEATGSGWWAEGEAEGVSLVIR